MPLGGIPPSPHAHTAGIFFLSDESPNVCVSVCSLSIHYNSVYCWNHFKLGTHNFWGGALTKQNSAIRVGACTRICKVQNWHKSVSSHHIFSHFCVLFLAQCALTTCQISLRHYLCKWIFYGSLEVHRVQFLQICEMGKNQALAAACSFHDFSLNFNALPL